MGLSVHSISGVDAGQVLLNRHDVMRFRTLHHSIGYHVSDKPKGTIGYNAISQSGHNPNPHYVSGYITTSI